MLEQGAAVRARDAQARPRQLPEIQTEMGRRGTLETERTASCSTPAPPSARPRPGHARAPLRPPHRRGRRAAPERSAELRGLLAEIAREHGINRALMRQELAFLAHLTRLIGHEPEPGYRPAGQAVDAAGAGTPRRRDRLDYEA